MNSEKNWNLQIDSGVFKFLRKIPRNNSAAILKAINLLPTDPYFGDIQKMKDEENSWRRRIGDYRIFYKIKTSERIILVFHLERRTSRTY